MASSWTDRLPPLPQLGDEMPLPQSRPEVLDYLASRRSLTVAQMREPGPSTEETAALLRLAARVPDHRRVHPFRFLTIEGTARDTFGRVLADAYGTDHPEASADDLTLEAQRPLRAPLLVAVISSVKPDHKTPVWEQILTAGAAAQNLLLAASAAGYAAQWLTEWYASHEGVRRALGLSEHEQVAGFIYIGTPADAPKERARMPADALTTAWTEHS